MTSRLSLLRLRLARLGRMRSILRVVAAWAAVGACILLVGLAVFAIDFWFRLAVGERLTILLLGAGVTGWTFWRFARPLLRQAETLTQTALFVERQQRIDSDLVAALQFEDMPGLANESRQLAGAVVDYVVAASPSIRVFHERVPVDVGRRVLLFIGCLTVVLLLASLAPRHAAVFANRVLLGSKQYPTRTQIEQVFVSRARVFSAEQADTGMLDCKAAQGRPLTFLVKCAGSLPASGIVDVAATMGAKERNRVVLHAVSAEQRLTWLRDAAARLSDVLQGTGTELAPQWKEDVLSLVHCDAADAAELLVAAKRTDELKSVADAVQRALSDLPENGRKTEVLTAEIGRLNEDLTYRIAAGDASTPPGMVKLIPLPIVQLEIVPHAPEYARGSEEPTPAPGSQLVVLEGSAVGAKVTSANKPLASVWFTVQRNGERERIEFSPSDSERRVWSPKDEPLLSKNLKHELKYELQVVDDDGLSLEAPIRGALRVRGDQLPMAVASVIHKVVLPTATPLVSYRFSDDFGIGQVTLSVETERGNSGDSTANAATTPGESASNQPSIALPAVIERKRFDLLPGKEVIGGERLPWSGSFSVPLSELNLLKGDRLKLTLEVRDYRGRDEASQPLGEVTTSEPVVLEIADESGVLAAIAEADKKSEQQLTEIIERQLGTRGERP